MKNDNYEEIFELAKEYSEIKENTIYTNSEEAKIKNKNKEIKKIIKKELLDEFFLKYGEIININEIKNIIEICINSYDLNEGINILVSSKFKVKNALDLYLANLYRKNIDNEIGLNILDLFERLYTVKIEERYPEFISKEIIKVLDETLYEYDGTQQFYINVVKKLKKNKIRK